MSQIRLSYNLDISDKSSWLTVTPAPSVRADFAYVQELGDFFCGPDYYTARENLPSYLIKLSLEGEGILEYDGKRYVIRQNQLFWIDCLKPQRYQTSPDVGHWHVLWVHLYGPGTPAYYRAFLEQSEGAPVITFEYSSPFEDLLNHLIDIYRSESNTAQDDIQASCLLTQLMAACVRSAEREPHLPRTPEYVTAIQAYIDANYHESLTLDALATRFSINKYYLQKLFKQHMGLSPGEYLTRTRLTRAKHLLRTTGDPIIQIASEVGYTASYFDDVFKKYEGVTPRAYRQRWYDPGNRS